MQGPPGYPPGGGYPPQPPGAPNPAPGGYGQQPGGYGQQPGGYGQQPGGYGAPQGAPAPQQGGYGPAPGAPGGYPPAGGPPQGGAYGAYGPGAPAQGGYGAPPQGGYGAPPAGGYGGPPGAFGGQGQPAAPAQKGPNVLAIVLIALLVVGVSSLGGCLFCVYVGSKGDSSTASSDSLSDGSGWITAEHPYVKFKAPPGWKQKIDGNWAVFQSEDTSATLAFTTFNQPGESTVKLGQAAGELGVSDINWGSPKSGNVGVGAFPARIGDGTCNFRGPGGYIEYATVNPGGSDQILLIYAVTASATKARKEEAQVAIKSLQHR